MTLIDKAEALLPCPFCGGEARISTRADECLWSHDQVEWTAISCSGGPDFDCFQPSVDWPSSATDEAGTQLSVSQWNRRAALPARGVGVKPWGWIGGNAACRHAHVNELAEGLQSCTSCGAVRSAALAPTDAAQARDAALKEAAAVVQAEFQLSEHEVAEGTRWCVNIGDFVAKRILALLSEART